MNRENVFSDRNSIFYQYRVFIKWLVTAVILGLIIGVAGTFFHKLLDIAGELRSENPLLIAALPLGGIVIVWCYSVCKMSGDKGTNGIIMGARNEMKVSLKTAPLIVIATLITHLLGGSAGREGAALQLGGSLASPFGKLFKMSEDDYSMLIMCGMAAGFSALFGTPAAAAVFAIEVTVIGLTRYSAIVPCVISALVAAMTANFFGVSPTSFSVESVPAFDYGSWITLLQAAATGIGGAIVSVIFCAAMEKTADIYKKLLPNPYLRVAAGGALVAALSGVIYLLTGSFDYNGAGTDIIAQAFAGSSRPEAFILKIIMTALTLGAGFKGGEIVPTLFVGSTFGCFLGNLMGMSPSFGAALGLAAVFCGVTNCPFATLLLTIELFGAQGLPYYALVIGLSYMLSGYRGLYSAQKFYGNKFSAGNIDRIFSYEDITEKEKK